MPNENYGDATFFHPALGSCGKRHDGTQPVVALSYKRFDEFTPGSNPNENTLCGKKIIVSYEGTSVVAEVVDRCADCEGYGDVDLAPSLFKELAPLVEGRIYVSWKWL